MARITRICHSQYIEDLRQAGYTDNQIEAELEYIERVRIENEYTRGSRDWNYGIHHVEN